MAHTHTHGISRLEVSQLIFQFSRRADLAHIQVDGRPCTAAICGPAHLSECLNYARALFLNATPKPSRDYEPCVSSALGPFPNITNFLCYINFFWNCLKKVFIYVASGNNRVFHGRFVCRGANFGLCISDSMIVMAEIKKEGIVEVVLKK